MKSGRHARILELVSEQSIETQDDLLNCLKRDGYKATQATISRDIKDLRLVKALDSDGREKTSQIAIENFDFTPPEKIKSVTTNYSRESNIITLNWDTPIDSDFNHVEISYTTNDGLTGI